jgi:indolepyruvate ferredoxin oxidoreductase beta subunit
VRKVDETFKKYFKNNAYIIDGQNIAKNLGNLQAANVVLVGAFSSFFPELKEGQFVKAIKSLLAPKLHDLNIKAFYEGKKAMERNV